MKAHLWNLDKIFEYSCIDLNTIIVISDTRIKNNITTLTSHVCSGQNILTKTIYHAVNVTSTEAELFTIRDRSIIQLLIKTKQFNYIPNFSCKSLARKRNMTSLFEIGKWHFKHQIIRGIIFLIFLKISIFLSNSHILRVELGLNYVGTLTCYVQKQ